MKVVQDLVCEVEIGAVLTAVVTETREYGAVVQLLRGRVGLLHMSEVGRPAPLPAGPEHTPRVVAKEYVPLSTLLASFATHPPLSFLAISSFFNMFLPSRPRLQNR